ncbi:EVE domain-containing protein [Roseomonas sp. CAU 1739]|uniref:EVE domain-containing protein n=1 Tax=Roseomonas sp. CAU 1739 TaxID=3140364 RepID=UPI00325C1625
MRGWIVVAAADHAARGQAGGFVQACHGKAAPLRRMRPGDGVVIYSPAAVRGVPVPLRAFTAIGTVTDGDPYRFDMGDGFVPWRRDVAWRSGTMHAPIAPLLGDLRFTAGRVHWGAPLRFGLLAIEPEDVRLIAEAMRAPPWAA